MCTSVKSPTPKEPEKKNPVYMRNPYLDGLGVGAESRGRNSLRIDRGSAAASPGRRTVPRMGYDDGAPLTWNTPGNSTRVVSNPGPVGRGINNAVAEALR